jgi:hypothetical protein
MAGVFQKRLVCERVQECQQVGLVAGCEIQSFNLDVGAGIAASPAHIVFDHILKRANRSIVHVRCGDRDVAQSGYPELATVAGQPSEGLPSDVTALQEGAVVEKSVVGQGPLGVAVKATGGRAEK